MSSFVISNSVKAEDPKETTELLKIENPFLGQSNIYEEIINSLNHEYEHIGRLEAGKILNNRWSITGGLNSVGFSYRRPYLNFGIALNRTVSPDLFSDTRWIVNDSLTITVDASKVLTKLKNENAIDISEKNLALFAGVVFERKYTWYHVANSYEEALSTQFEKLFFPFLGIKYASLKKFSPEEYIIRTDSVAINAGGIATVPIYQGINGIMGALFKYEQLSKMELTRIKNDSTDGLQISISNTKSKLAGVALSIQADFLKILKMTLLHYEFNYTFEKTYKLYTQIPMQIITESDENSNLANEIIKMTKLKEPSLIILAPYIISEENRESEIKKQKYGILLYGGTKEAKTEKVEIVSNGIAKTFFKHYFEKIKYREDLMSKLFSSFIFKIFNFEPKATNNSYESKKLSLEYNSERNLLEEREDIELNNSSENLSLRFEGQFFTKKVSGFLNRGLRERALFHLQNYSGVDPVALELVKNDSLAAPYEIIGKYQVNLDGVKYFSVLNPQIVFSNIDGICSDRPKNKFFNLRNLFDFCRIGLEKKYLDYLKDFTHDKVSLDKIEYCHDKSKKFFFRPSKKRAFIKDCLSQVTYLDESNRMIIPLYPLKNFTQELSNSNQSKVYFYNLFGLSNVFFNGHFSAKTEDGADFITYFHEGQFKGFGSIDHHMRAANLRNPASLIINEN